MDDGSPDRSGYLFYTDNFTQAEVQLLVSVLKDNFDLNCSIQTRNGKINKSYMIYVKADSTAKFKSLVEPYIIPHFHYKLVLRGSAKSS